MTEPTQTPAHEKPAEPKPEFFELKIENGKLHFTCDVLDLLKYGVVKTSKTWDDNAVQAAQPFIRNFNFSKKF